MGLSNSRAGSLTRGAVNIRQHWGGTPFVVLFVSAFGAATILPFPSEVPLLFVVRDTGQVFWPVVVATCTRLLSWRLYDLRARPNGRQPARIAREPEVVPRV